jgi:hypothetical protein
MLARGLDRKPAMSRDRSRRSLGDRVARLGVARPRAPRGRIGLGRVARARSARQLDGSRPQAGGIGIEAKDQLRGARCDALDQTISEAARSGLA